MTVEVLLALDRVTELRTRWRLVRAGGQPLRLRDVDFGWTLPSGATVILPTTDSVLPFPGLPGASSGIGGVTSAVPTSGIGVLPTSGLPGVTDHLPSNGLPGVNNVLPSTTLGSISVPGVTGVPTLGLTSIGALPTDSGLLSANVGLSSTIGASVTVGGVTLPVSVPVSAPISGTVDVSGALTGIMASASVPLASVTLLHPDHPSFPLLQTLRLRECLFPLTCIWPAVMRFSDHIGLSASYHSVDLGWNLSSGATDTFPTTDSGLAFSCLRVVLSGIGGMNLVLPTSASVPFVSATATIPAASSLLPAMTSGLNTGLVGAANTLDSTIGASASFPFVTAFVSVP
ncbi:hypothetical protein OC844_005842 [Tilletia horrida]|nr:hypothetical protein OC844_005842 [Tilletia horrida]